MSLARFRGTENPGAATEILEAAKARLATRLDDVLPQIGRLVREDALEELEAVVFRVSSAIHGQATDVDPDTGGRPALHQRLIEELRGEILRDAPDPKSALATVEVLRALEIAMDTPEDAEDLRARLARPDALQLLVEVAHDLRSPLTSILFLSETLRVGYSGDVNDLQRSQLGLIYSAALGLVSVTSDVVDLAREREGNLEGRPELFYVVELFQGIEEMVRPMAEEKGIDLRVNVSDYERSHGYPVALSRVLLNLTTNALKFTDQGYVEIGVERLSPSQLSFYVRDTGRGLDEERKKELFHPFKKRQGAEGHFFSGSGVGLSIARRLARSMGSELRCESSVGWGTRFSFVIDDPGAA